jgi:hypothetical protein
MQVQAVTEPDGWPIRIAVRIDFSDGSEHTCEVRGADAVDAPGGFWPEGVVTSDVAQRIDYARKRADEIRQLKRDVESLLVVATLYLDAFTDDDLMALPEKMRHQEVEEIVQRRGRRY